MNGLKVDRAFCKLVKEKLRLKLCFKVLAKIEWLLQFGRLDWIRIYCWKTLVGISVHLI